jgi:hypothetical protein
MFLAAWPELPWPERPISLQVAQVEPLAVAEKTKGWRKKKKIAV